MNLRLWGQLLEDKQKREGATRSYSLESKITPQCKSVLYLGPMTACRAVVVGPEAPDNSTLTESGSLRGKRWDWGGHLCEPVPVDLGD